jgi:hypothetical protein
MIPSGIEPATFRFVAQYLNHCSGAPTFSEFTRSYRENHDKVTGFLNENLNWKLNSKKHATSMLIDALSSEKVTNV